MVQRALNVIKMHNKKTLLLLTLILFSLNFAYAQQNKSLYKSLRNAIDLNQRVFVSEKFFEKAVFFSVNISVDEKGIVDSVFFSDEKNEDLNKILSFKNIREVLIKNKKDFVGNKNEVLVLIVMISRGEDYNLKFNNSEEIIKNWIAIGVTSKKINELEKKQIFLGPLLINARGAKNYRHN
jgi:hypothetical protein